MSIESSLTAPPRSRKLQKRLQAARYSVSPRHDDLVRYAGKARRGEIPLNSVNEHAAIFAACRSAIAVAPRGYLPLDAIADSLPAEYVASWIRKRRKMSQRTAA